MLEQGNLYPLLLTKGQLTEIAGEGGWRDGASVVVRDRESLSHGEGKQTVDGESAEGVHNRGLGCPVKQ